MLCYLIHSHQLQFSNPMYNSTISFNAFLIHRNGDVWLIRQQRRMSDVVKKKSRDHKNLSSETSFIISVPSSSLPWWVMSLRSGQSDNPEKMVQGQRDKPEPFLWKNTSSGSVICWFRSKGEMRAPVVLIALEKKKRRPLEVAAVASES